MRWLLTSLRFRRYFQNCSIRQKLMIIIMGVSTLTLVLISAVFMVNDAQTIRNGMVQDLSAVGKIIGDRSKASLTFDDARVATENLASLAAKSSIVAACIYDAEDNVFASYYRDISGIPCPSVKSPQYYFDDASLHVYQPILQAQDKLGTIYIRADLNEIKQSLNQYILYAAGFVLLALLVAYILSAKLQAVVSEPLTRLARTVRAVSTEADYSIRAEK
ncbi:MAG: hypothetical protein IT567_00515, partial [Alphaproteobacteria bacterium]|nr:hypothetical protein [Alphaproteobacteria bacterium]